MQFDQETCSLIFKNRSSFSVIGTQSYSRIIEIMEDFLSHFPGSAHADWVLCVIQRWIHVRKPRQRLTTTLKLLSKEFEENFSEIWEQCAKSRNDSGKIQTTRNLRQDLVRLQINANFHQKMIDHHTRCLSKSWQKLNTNAEHRAKIEIALISRALPCVNRLFNAVFHEHKGFNIAFVFHMVNNIVNKGAETTQKALQ